ncbi:MAG TPA: GlpM family protein [Psychrobacter sp.]|nr:GlpM family protein [Psychrobacter sp.]HSP85531.1 GlpM family protein [Psychrobacter sp.]
MAALAALFSTFTLISHFLVGTQRSTADLKAALVFSHSNIAYGYILTNGM